MKTTEDQSIHWQCVEGKRHHCVWPLVVVLACLRSHQVLLTTHTHTHTLTLSKV